MNDILYILSSHFVIIVTHAPTPLVLMIFWDCVLLQWRKVTVKTVFLIASKFTSCDALQFDVIHHLLHTVLCSPFTEFHSL